jgi:hypothetical protein
MAYQGHLLPEAMWRWLKISFDTYRPELYYMRGPGPKWREKHARRRRLRELDQEESINSTETRPMNITEYVAATARAFMASEIAMAAVNCGTANVTRAQAENLLDDYFARVEQAIPWTENNPLDRRS